MRLLSRSRASAPSKQRRYALLLGVLFLVGYILPLGYFYHRSLRPIFVDSPRNGEVALSDDDFYDCVAERLSYKSDHPDRIPYVLIPVTMDYQDLKQLFCNITAPMTYIMIINNGQFSPLRGLLDGLAAKCALFLNRNLFIRHHPENTGYASAVNEGLRHVLTLSVEEVPWVFITNADVRFAPPLIPEFVRQTNALTATQGEVISRLDREVAEESLTVAAAADRRFAYRSSAFPIVTATSLPYRIRKMPFEEMRQQFAQTYGMFFTDSKAFMATFAISRLVIATVGLFDENYYPAYGEDHDYVWRMEALGFRKYTSAPGLFTHFYNANLNVNGNLESRGFIQSTAYKLQTIKIKRMNYQPFRLYYRREKWFPGHPKLEANSDRKMLPFDGRLPVDMWVLDKKRRDFIWQVGEGEQCRRNYPGYNISLIDFAV